VDDALIEEIWGGARGLEPLVSGLPDITDGGWLEPVDRIKAGEPKRARTASSQAPPRDPELLNLVNLAGRPSDRQATEPAATWMTGEPACDRGGRPTAA
jgi:hypothetical protein